MMGGARAQYHLRQVFVFLNMWPINRPEVIVTFAAEKIKDGKVVDENTRKYIRGVLEQLIAWHSKIRN